MYQGVIIEENLEDNSILKSIKILQTKTESVTPEHQTPWVKKWTLRTVEIPDDAADTIANKLAEKLDPKHAWYADFKNDKYHYIIFFRKIFRVDRSRPQEYEAVTNYGLILHIPAYQLDFSPAIKQWERKQN